MVLILNVFLQKTKKKEEDSNTSGKNSQILPVKVNLEKHPPYLPPAPEGLENHQVCWFMVFNAAFNNISVISWRSVLLMEETGSSQRNHQPAASHWQTFIT